MPNFAVTAKEYEESRGDEGEVWIKGFRDGETRIRILEEPDDMNAYLEHYADGFGRFPCSKEPGCVGCADDDPKTRQRSRRFAFNGLDDQGRLNVYKVGSRLHRQMKSKFARLGSITDRDYTIVRSGKTLDEIQYDMEAGEVYEVDDDGTRHDIPQIHADRYAAAVAAFGGEAAPKVDTSKATSNGHGASNGRIKPAAEGGRIKPAATPAKAAAKAKPAPEAPEVDEAQGELATQVDAADESIAAKVAEAKADYPVVADMTTPALQAFLREHEVEFAKNAPRSRLAKLADKWIAENPPW